MLKKLAHSAILPSLTGNLDLRPLQEVITAEKHVLQSLQKLSIDLTKSSDALRGWAHGEGDDLRDTFSACSVLFNHWVTSLGSFAANVARIRECMKAIRTKEEALEDMRNRRKALISKADDAEKKLNRAGKNNKNLQQQTDLLLGLRGHIKALDTEIMTEQTGLGDFKRVKAKEWMGVLFGALLECSEKGVVIAKSCRSVLGHISTGKTQPGRVRTQYAGRPQVRDLVVVAERELQGIRFTSEVGNNIQTQVPPTGNVPTQTRGPPIRNVIHKDPPQRPPIERPLSAIGVGNPPSYASTPTQPMASHPLRHYRSLDSNRRNRGGIDFGDFDPSSQPQTFTPGQRNHHPTDQQLDNLVRSARNTPQPFSAFAAGHGHQPSQSSQASSALISTPTTPLSPHLHGRQTTFESDIDELPDKAEEPQMMPGGDYRT